MAEIHHNLSDIATHVVYVSKFLENSWILIQLRTGFVSPQCSSRGPMWLDQRFGGDHVRPVRIKPHTGV